MKKIFLVGLFFYCSSASAQFGTPNAMVWSGMPYGNPALWSSQLTHSSQYSTGSNVYDPSIERARIDNDYHRAETYWRKRELWEKYNPPVERKKITRKPFDTSRIYAEGRVLWPVIFKDKDYIVYTRKIERIIEYTGERTWNQIKEFNKLVDSMEQILQSRVHEYPARYYGQAKVFLNDLQRILS